MRFLSLVVLALFVSCSVTPDSATDSRFEILVLGTAQDGGMPHVGCSKDCCARARREGRVLYPACLAIHDRTSGELCLIEATPRIEPQLALLHEMTRQLQRQRRPVDAVLLTHAHMGHYLGLLQFGKEVAATRRLPVYVSSRFAEFLRTNGPWRQLVEMDQITLREVGPGEPFEPLPGVRVEAVRVPHREEYTDTLAFRIHGPNRTVLFVPDVDSWARQPDLLPRLIEGVDVAYIDATFYDGSELPDRVMAKVRHPFITDTMRLLAQPARERPGRFRFIHLNHTNPALHDRAIQRKIRARGFRIARRGERVAL